MNPAEGVRETQRVQISKVGERDAPHCAYCRDGIAKADPTVRCQRCHARLHPACRDELFGCPTLGCEGLWSDHGQRKAPRLRLRRLGLAFLVVMVAGAGVSVYSLVQNVATQTRIRDGAATVADVPELLDMLGSTHSTSDSQIARRALLDMGPAIVTDIVDAMYDSPESWTNARSVIDDMGVEAVEPLRTKLLDQRPSARTLAAWSLGDLGPLAQPAVDDLARVYREARGRHLKEVAARSLGQIGGPEAARVLLEALRQRWGARKIATLSLQRVAQPHDEEVLDVLLETLDSVSLPVLAEIDHPWVIGGLAGALQGPNAIPVAEALCELGPAAKAAVPALAEALSAPDPALRLAAARALEAMLKEARPALPHLRIALRAPRRELSNTAARILARLGEEGTLALARALDDPQDHVREAALSQLLVSGLGEDTRGVVMRMAQEGPTPTRVAALQVLSRLGSTGIPTITHCLAPSNDRPVRLAAIAALYALDSQAAFAAPALEALRQDDDAEVREKAAEARKRIRLLGQFRSGMQAAQEEQ